MKVIDFKKIVYPEACGSVRGFTADVPRYAEVEVQGFDEKGEPLKMQANGWKARIIQHEMDHLDGKLYTDFMDRKTLSCTCWEEVNRNAGKVELPFY